MKYNIDLFEYLLGKGKMLTTSHFLLSRSVFYYKKDEKIQLMKWHWLGVLLSEINDSVAESVDRDQTAHSCRLVLLYTLRKMNTRSQTAR